MPFFLKRRQSKGPLFKRATHAPLRLGHGFSTFWPPLFLVAPWIKVREPNADLTFTVRWKLWQEGLLSFEGEQAYSIANGISIASVSNQLKYVMHMGSYIHYLFKTEEPTGAKFLVRVRKSKCYSSPCDICVALRSDGSTRTSASHHHRAFAPKRCLIPAHRKGVTGPNILAGNKRSLQRGLTASILHGPAPDEHNADEHIYTSTPGRNELRAVEWKIADIKTQAALPGG